MELEKLWGKVRGKANVVGYSKKLQPRIRDGKIVEDELCFRVYVTQKLPLSKLSSKDIIPKSIDGIPTDVIEIGEIKALVDKTKKFRPVIFGISIGHIYITAGTNGFLFVDGKGEKYFGSNAHVFVDNPSKEPKDVDVKDIIQPGKYDGGTIDDKVAEYVWHKRIIPSAPSTCPIAKVWAGIYNTVAKILKSKTRLVPILEAVNKIDFAVAKPVTDYEVRFPDFDYVNHKFVGLGFAGSDLTSVVCKVKYIVEEGYKPFNVDTVEVKEGDTVCKTGRSSCFTTAKVIDSSSHVRVNYDSFEAEFDDVVLTTKLLEAGDSGSSVWL